MEVEVLGAGPDLGHAGAVGALDEVVDGPLLGAEGAARGEGAGDVGGVEALGLHPHVEEERGVGEDGAVAADPVEDGRVRAGADDGGVAGAVAVGAGVAVEGALEPALAESFADGARDLAGDGGEAFDGGVYGEAHLVDLPGVLDHAQD